MFLQMAAEKELGEARRNDLDRLTVTLSHPDGMAALLAGQEVTAHFTAAPIQELELRRPGIRTILNSFDVLGGPSTFNVVWASAAFVEANPTVHAAFTAALEEAVGVHRGRPPGRRRGLCAPRPRRLRCRPDRVDPGLAPGHLHDHAPGDPARASTFMARTKVIRRGAQDWRELFFANVHAKPGS